MRRRYLVSTGLAVGLGLTIAGLGRSADDNHGLGSGADGAFTAAQADEVINKYVAVTGAAAAGATTVTVAGTDDLAVNDLVLIVQTSGAALTSTTTDPPAPVDLAAAKMGQYDVVKVKAKAATTITVEPALKNEYLAAGAQVVRVPQYTTVSVPDTTSLTAKAWDGTTGGVLAFLAQGAVTLTGSGTLHADAKGFRGGNRSIIYCTNTCSTGEPGTGDADDALCQTAGKGESFDNSAAAYGATGCGLGARGTGGGGGGHVNAGGAGGGNGGPGGRGGNGWNSGAPIGGYPGAAVNVKLIDRLTFGGGGGGGQQNNSSAPDSGTNEGRGGAGGGIIWFRGLSLAAEASIHANGQRGFDGNSDGAGGGGAGGSILARIVNNADCVDLAANGGDGGNIAGHGPGGGGGPGRVRLEARGGTCATATATGALGTGGIGTPNAPGAPPGETIEDAGTAGFGCVDSGACAAATPICDSLAHVCRGCRMANECSTGFCATDGRCTAPPVDAGPDSGPTDGGGTSDAGGSSSGGSSSGGSSSSSGGTDAGPSPAPAEEDSGCGCKTVGPRHVSTGGIGALLAGVLGFIARRRRARSR